MRKPSSLSIAGLMLLCACVGCDPIINIAGANFPAWLFCAIVGGIVAIAFRPVFVTLGIEPYLWPLPAVYIALAVLAACVVYLAFFRI
ncbi:MAG TPA: YtcA family lipoprotein [Candidatus Binataceae bacterium]|nr:YtcA family lipoprotein [Candidatus Binataceae bacterium]